MTNKGDVPRIQKASQRSEISRIGILIRAECSTIRSLTKITNTRRIVSRRIELSIQSIGSTHRTEQQRRRFDMIVTIDDIQTTIA